MYRNKIWIWFPFNIIKATQQTYSSSTESGKNNIKVSYLIQFAFQCRYFFGVRKSNIQSRWDSIDELYLIFPCSRDESHKLLWRTESVFRKKLKEPLLKGLTKRNDLESFSPIYNESREKSLKFFKIVMPNVTICHTKFDMI